MPAPTVAPVTATSYTSLFSTFNADGTRLLINPGTALQLIDPQTGASVATNGVALPTMAAHPSWSPDGNSIVFVNNISLGGAAAPWAVDYDRGDLAGDSRDSVRDTFGAPVSLVTAATADPAYRAHRRGRRSRPTRSTSRTRAGTNSRGRNTVNNVEVRTPARCS